MKIISYYITLDEPVLVTALEGDPNTAASFAYLPGSVLRGAIIAAYMRQNRLKELDDTDETVRRLFFDGQTCYLNGYLTDREDQRSLPRPLSWQQEKEAQRKETEDNPAGLYDFAYEKQDDAPQEPKQWKPPKKPFFSFAKTNGKIRWLSPDKTLAVHTQRDPVMGRSTTERGAVYQYESLAAGQTFAAAILCANDTDAETLSGFLDGSYNLGGSRGAGYGRVQFQTVPTTNEREMPSEIDVESNGRFTVTCLSDLILQDEQGQFQADPELAKAALEQKLKCDLRWFESDRPVAFMNGTHLGGFNRKWGLPLPQVKAISMGSVFVFEPPDCAIEQLQTIEAQGIGLRRAEGFGRIAFNWQTEGEWFVEGYVPGEQPTAISLAVGTSEGQLAQMMVNRLFRQQLDAELAVKANGLAKKLLVQNSQLSRLRQVVQDELHKRPSESDPSAPEKISKAQTRLLKYTEKLRKRAVTRKQFDRARIDNQPLLDWLDERVQDKSTIEVIQPVVVPAIGETNGSWTDAIRYEYNLRLVDMTLAYCLKQGTEDN
jgi:CRISPR-associated protein Csx10